MVRPPEDLRKRLEELLDRCERFLPPHARLDAEGIPQAKVTVGGPISESWRFLISALQTVASACGRDSPHLRDLELCRAKFLETRNLDLDMCRGVLLAARDDFDAGMLLDVRQLVAAEAFGDLLESAVHLLEENHHLPAVAIAGAVLESSLRELADRGGVTWSGHSGITKVNGALKSANTYDKTVWAEVEAWAQLRNKVDHGNFTAPGDVDVSAARRMVDGVRQFVLKYR